MATACRSADQSRGTPLQAKSVAVIHTFVKHNLPGKPCSGIHRQSHGGPCFSPWLIRLMFRDVPLEEPIHCFPAPEMQLECKIGFSYGPVLSLIRKMAPPQSNKSSYRSDCATKRAVVQNTEKHFTSSVQRWALDISAGFSMVGLEEISCHEIIAIHTGYLIS